MVTPEQPIRRIGYEPGFDGIRATGAIFAVTAHATMVVLPNDNAGLPELVPGTFVFMDAFFSLSGFLITALLLKEQIDAGDSKINLRGFYRRRALRLLPALWLLLVAHYLYALYAGYDMEVERNTIWAVFTFRVNLAMDHMLAPLSRGLTQLWSLSLEEQFYLLWPLVTMFILPLRRSLKVTVTVLVGAMILISIRRYLMWADGTNWMRIYTHTDTRADSLLLGCLVAHLWVRHKTPVKGLVMAAWVATGFLAWSVVNLSVDGDFANKGGYTLLALAWATILLAAIDGRWIMCKVISSRPFRAMGRLSYGIYLWHLPIQIGVAEQGSNLHPLMRLVVSSVLTGVVVIASWKLVEQPIIRYKNRLEGRPDRPEDQRRPAFGRSDTSIAAESDLSTTDAHLAPDHGASA